MAGVIVSLTSYGERIKVVHKVVESLKNQTIQANKIILWLDETELTREELPKALSKLEDELFEVCFCPNYKSYKKLIPTLARYPDSAIITFDDDILIPPSTISAFVDASNKNPKTIIAARGRLMSADADGEFATYTSWSLINNLKTMTAKYCIIPIGYGGVLYPSGSLNQSVLDINEFTRLADNADDIWFKCMSLLNHTPVLLLPKSVTENYKTIDDTQGTALYLTVNTDDRNRKCLTEIALQYPQLKTLFCSEVFNQINVDSLFLEELLTKPNLFPNKKSAVDFFISTALKIENSHTQVAFQLMSLAKKCRPKGPLINRKLSKYKQKMEK